MSNETCKVCGRLVAASLEAASFDARVCGRPWFVRPCIEIGYTRELAAREAAEKEVAALRESGEVRGYNALADSHAKAAAEIERLAAENTRQREALAELLRCFESEHMCRQSPQSGCCSLLNRQRGAEPCSRVRWARDFVAMESGRTSDNTAICKPEPCPPGCAEHGEQGS